MSMNRAEQIRASLAGLGTDPETGYTHREIIDRLIALENALLAGVYEKNHAENMRPQDLTKHFSALAEEFGLDKSDTYKRFVANMDELDHAVKSFIAGQKGERLARSSLRPLTFDKSVKILYNVLLENEELKTEYDAIVITPHGIFVVEVKNWPGEVTLNRDGILTRRGSSITNNLGARMVVKESLLRECLGELFPLSYHSVLLFPEDKTTFKDEYHQIAFSYGASIANCIKFCRSGQPCLTDEQSASIVDKITEANQEIHTFCEVRCDEIIEDFAVLMAQMENASSEVESTATDEDAGDDGIEFSIKASVDCPEANLLLKKGKEVIRSVEWKKAGKAVAGIALALVSGFVVGRVCTRK